VQLAGVDVGVQDRFMFLGVRAAHEHFQRSLAKAHLSADADAPRFSLSFEHNVLADIGSFYGRTSRLRLSDLRLVGASRQLPRWIAGGQKHGQNHCERGPPLEQKRDVVHTSESIGPSLAPKAFSEKCKKISEKS